MKKEKRICLVSTQYCLLLYLLFCSIDEIKETFFIFTNGISHEIVKKFPKSVFFEENKTILGKKVKQWLYCFYLRIFKLGFVGRSTRIFAQDHLLISPSLLYNKDYILIEDSPYVESYHRNSNRFIRLEQYKNNKRYKIIKLLYGKTILNYYGNNELCKGIIMSVNDHYVDFLDGKPRYICDLKEAWTNSSEEKKNLILSIFNISEEDIEILRKHKSILFTQPLYPDRLEMEEHREVFSKIIQKYPKEGLIIKRHPRDVCDYTSIARGVTIFERNIPSQLLDLLGIRFDLAITPFSSAVLHFNYPIKIDWYGTECHPKLYDMFGHLPAPRNARIRKLDDNL